MSEVKNEDEDGPEEGEIQDDDGSLEDVSSGEDVSSIYCKETPEDFCGNKFAVSHVMTEYATRSSRPPNSRAHNACKHERVSSPVLENQSRLSVIKYREETNKYSNGGYHVTLNTVAVEDRRRDDNFVHIPRPKEGMKFEDIVQEKENRSDCQKETKIKRKCRRKQRHSLLSNPESRPSISSDIKADYTVRSEIIRPEEENRKKRDVFTKLGTKSKSSHSRKRCVTPKREKHRSSKKKDGRKYVSKTVLDKIEKSDCTANGASGSSLLMRLQTMMMVNVPARKEKTPSVNLTKKDEDIVKGQELEHDLGTDPLPSLDTVKSGNEDEKGCLEIVETVGETNHNHLLAQTSDDIEVLFDVRKPEPVVITIDDSDNEVPGTAKVSGHDLPEKENEEGDEKAVGGEMVTKGINSSITKGTGCDGEEEEDLVQLRLLALQSNRRKGTSKPRMEDDEVMQLRLEALKSAIIKKCQVRKQRGIALKSKKDLGGTDMQDYLGQEVQKAEATCMKTLWSEPDETTALVDMDLSHTDDESNAQSEIIVDPVSVDIPLCGSLESRCLPLMHEDYSTQNVPCIDVPLVKVHEDNHVDLKQSEANDVMSAWNPAAAMLENCQLSGMYNNNVHISSLNSFGFSSSQVPFPSSSSFSQQQLCNEAFQSNNGSDLPCADFESITSETVLNPIEVRVSSGVRGSFVVSDASSSYITSDAVSVSRAEPQVVGLSPSLETNSLGPDVPRSHSVAATKDPPFPSVSSSTVAPSVQFHTVDRGNDSCQSGVESRNVNVHSENDVYFEKLPPAVHTKPTGSSERDPSTLSSMPVALISCSLNPHNQELQRTNAEDIHQNPVPISARETVENRADCNVQENPSELENIDLSNMIVLDEIGHCSSPETKVEEVSVEPGTMRNEGISPKCDEGSCNLDEDEEMLRAKVLTTLARKHSTSTALLTSKPQNMKDNAVSGPPKMSSKQQIEASTHSLPVSPNHISASSINSVQAVPQTSVNRTKEEMPSKFPGSIHEVKQCNKVFQRLPNKKLELSQSVVSNYTKGNIIKAKYWKRPVKKGFAGSNVKQILTVVNRNPVLMKQVREPSADVKNNPQNTDLGLKTQCKPVDSTVPRVVFQPWGPQPTMIQVTVPTTGVSNKQCKRKIAASVVSSVQPSQRFVIRLGDDSDSPDEENKARQVPQATKRRCVMKNGSSVPSLRASTSDVHIASCDQVVKCDSNVASSLLSQYDRPLSKKRNTISLLTSCATDSRMSSDFEKSVDIFLKQQRKSQETTAKETLTLDKSVGRKANQVITSATPLAVRHLPSSQQEEYRRLKQQIAKLEEQRRRCQQGQQQEQKQLPSTPPQPLSTNMTNSESSSVPSSPSRTAAASNNTNRPLTSAAVGKTGMLQSSVTSAELESYSGKILRVQTVQNKTPSNVVTSNDALLQKETASEKGVITPTPASLAPVMSEEEQKATTERPNNLDNTVRQEEESEDGVHEEHDVDMLSSCKCDSLSTGDESLEQKEARLAEIEHQLLSKRYEVLDDLTNMTTLLHQVERERTSEEECLKELRRIRGELRRVEERLSQQKELLSNMCNDMGKSHQRVAQGRAECIGLSKTCLSLGISVKGRSYKVPAGGAELMNRKLQQVATQTRRMSRRKDNSEDSDENPCGSGMPSFLNLQVPVQDKPKMRTESLAVESSKNDSTNCSKLCASHTMDVNTESVSQENETMPIQFTENASMLVSSSDISQIKSTNSSDLLHCKLSELSSKSSIQSPLISVSETITGTTLKLGSHFRVEGDSGEAESGQPPVTDIEQMSTDVPEASDMAVMAVGSSSSKETVSQHMTEYRSPLDHFYSERGESKGESEWCGPLDPLAILCPYELMGSCQDEECGYQHQSKSCMT